MMKIKNEELCNLYHSQFILSIIKSGRISKSMKNTQGLLKTF